MATPALIWEQLRYRLDQDGENAEYTSPIYTMAEFEIYFDEWRMATTPCDLEFCFISYSDVQLQITASSKSQFQLHEFQRGRLSTNSKIKLL